MNYKTYYESDINDIPDIDKSDLVPGTFLVGTIKSIIVLTFPYDRSVGYKTSTFDSNTDIAVIISVKNDNKDTDIFNEYENTDMILLNLKQNMMFVGHSKSKLFVKLGPR